MDNEKKIKELEKKLLTLENLFKQHKHNGLDGRAIDIQDITNVLYNSYTIDPGSLADGVGETQQVTFTGANLGDFVLVSAPYDLQDITVTGYVQAQDTVEIRLQNESGGTVDLASGLWRVLIIRNII